MKAYELLEETDWCQNNYAENIEGADVSSNNPHAVRYCIQGAVQRCYNNITEERAAYERIASLLPVSYRLYITPGAACVKWNDRKGRKKKDVIALLKAADV